MNEMTSTTCEAGQPLTFAKLQELLDSLPPIVPRPKVDLWPHGLNQDVLEAGPVLLEGLGGREGARVFFVPRSKLHAIAQELAQLGADVLIQPGGREVQPMRYLSWWYL